jgi:hypothetical protein
MQLQTPRLAARKSDDGNTFLEAVLGLGGAVNEEELIKLVEAFSETGRTTGTNSLLNIFPKVSNGRRQYIGRNNKNFYDIERYLLRLIVRHVTGYICFVDF